MDMKKSINCYCNVQVTEYKDCLVHLSFCSFCSETGEAVLHILEVSVEDSGVYTCVATNVAGSVTSSASLRVSGESYVIVTIL